MVELLRLALATFRLARMIALEEGPARIFVRVRAWAGAFDYGLDGQPLTSLGRGIACPYCLGIYVAGGLLLANKFGRTRWVVTLLSIAGLQTLLQSWESKI